MAKQTDTPEPAATPAPVAPSKAVLAFRDKRYTSRVLILPADRQLSVVRGRVEVATDDAVALAYLRKHADFESVQG